MLQDFGTDVWIADGPVVVGGGGFRYPTRMAVMRLADGELVVWSPVSLSPELRQAVDGLGPVGFIIPPNALHHSFVGEWQSAYPHAKTLAPPKLAEKRTDLRFDGALTATAPSSWEGQIDLVVFENAIASEAILFHRPSGTAVFTDLLQNLPEGWYHGWRALVARLDLMTGPVAEVPRKFRLATRDRTAARASLAEVLEWPTERILMAHGRPILTDARQHLRRAFSWLTR